MVCKWLGHGQTFLKPCIFDFCFSSSHFCEHIGNNIQAGIWITGSVLMINTTEHMYLLILPSQAQTHCHADQDREALIKINT